LAGLFLFRVLLRFWKNALYPFALHGERCARPFYCSVSHHGRKKKGKEARESSFMTPFSMLLTTPGDAFLACPQKPLKSRVIETHVKPIEFEVQTNWFEPQINLV
jgi:hypothetical protein